MSNNKKSSVDLAKKAAQTLRDDSASKMAKRLAGSVLAQRDGTKRTGADLEDVREGHRGGGAGSLDWRRGHAQGGRPGASPGDFRHQPIPGLGAVRRDRRTGELVPQPPDRGRMAVPVAGCPLSQGAPRRARGIGGGYNCLGGKPGRPTRDPGAGDWRIRSQALLGEVSDPLETAGTPRREMGDLGRA